MTNDGGGGQSSLLTLLLLAIPHQEMADCAFFLSLLSLFFFSCFFFGPLPEHWGE